MRTPVAVSVGADQRNSEQYAVQVSQSGLGMPDRDYYLKDEAKEKERVQVTITDSSGALVREIEQALPEVVS